MLEVVRIILLLVMLGVTSYLDLRYREISDKYWFVFGAVGTGLYLFDWQDHTTYDGLTIAVTLTIALLMWRFFPIGKADILAFVCIGILVPTLSEFVMVPIVVFAGSAIVSGIFVISYNVILNTKDSLGSRHGTFHTFDESAIRKSFAFFMIHKKRKREKFAIRAESITNGKKRFCLGLKNIDSEFTKKDDNDIFVESGTPMLPYMLGVYVFLILTIL